MPIVPHPGRRLPLGRVPAAALAGAGTIAAAALADQQGEATVTLRDARCQATIAPGGDVRFGFPSTWTGSDATRAAFALNGAASG